MVTRSCVRPWHRGHAGRASDKLPWSVLGVGNIWKVAPFGVLTRLADAVALCSMSALVGDVRKLALSIV